MKLQRIVAGVLVALFTFGSIFVCSNAATYNGSNIISNNIHDHEYTNTSQVSNSYMIANPDGTVSRLESFGDIILLEKYNSSFACVSQSFLSFEGTIFGGFYAGNSYNYLIFGNNNMDQQSNFGVIKIVRYSKSWQRLSECYVNNCNTTVPFKGSNTSFCEYGNLLYIRCGHQTYKDASGLYHQSSMTICYDNATNKVTDISCTIRGTSYASTENSGAQFIGCSNGVVGTCEASLTGPYGVLFSRYGYTAGRGTLANGAAAINTLGAAGALTSNIPAYSIGGFDANSQYFLAVGSSQPMDGTSSNMNLFVTRIPVNTFSGAQVKTSYLTGYAQGDPHTIGTPFLVKVNANRYAILYEVRNGYSDMGEVSYLFIDAAGNRISDTATVQGCLSDCQPVVFGDKIVWYTTNGASMKIYTVPAGGTSASNNTSVYTTEATTAGGVNYSKVFDFAYYCSKYPEIRVAFGNDEAAALSHFINCGMAEGRQGCAGFNLAIYMYNYPDLVAVFGNNYKLYYEHFMNYGYAEGRNAMTKNH